MAGHTVTSQTLVDGRRHTVIKVNIKGDSGTAAELSTNLFVASAYLTQSTNNAILEVEYCLNGFSIELFWDANSPVPAMSLANGHPTHQKFRDVGGIVNNGSTGRTGNITMTTTGLSSSTKDGYILLYVGERKTAAVGTIN